MRRDPTDVHRNHARSDERDGELGRREVLVRGLCAAAGLLGLPAGARLASAAATDGASAGSRVRGHGTLGRTGLRISDISIGTGALGSPEVLRRALEQGVNYIDTADGYPLGAPGRAERLIGAELGARRKDLILATKTNTEPDVSRGELMAKLEGSLRRLRTDYVDVYFNQAVNDVRRVRNPEWPEFVSRAKQQGKIRFSGMSGHGGRLVECLDTALEQDLFDVILVAYNFGQDPAFYERLTLDFDIVANQVDLPRVLAKAHAKGVGVLAMKTLMGAKLNDMRPWESGGHTFAQAALRWVLSNPNVDGLIITMKKPEQVDEFLGASGSRRLSWGDRELLERYLALHAGTHCRIGCSACESSCPEGVRISDVLRSRMYAVDYGEPAMGRASYADVEVNATACASCAHESCVRACPYGLPVAALTRSSEALLGRG